MARKRAGEMLPYRDKRAGEMHPYRDKRAGEMHLSRGLVVLLLSASFMQFVTHVGAARVDLFGGSSLIFELDRVELSFDGAATESFSSQFS